MRKPLVTLGLLAAAATTISAATSTASADEARPTPWKLLDTSSDIDGDGTIDGVYLRRASADACKVKVGLSEGRGSVFTIPMKRGELCTYKGSALIDNVGGSEIAVRTKSGPKADRYLMLTWRDGGGLTVQKSPSGTPRWKVADNGDSVDGYSRIRNANGQVRLVHHQLTNDGHLWNGTREMLAYRGDSWVRVGGSEVTLQPRVAAKRAGWHLSKIPAEH